jgi:hypothetical protein
MDDLQKEWNKRLSKEGLPIIRGSEKVPVDVTMEKQANSAILESMYEGSREELENLLEKFDLLSSEAQKTIFADIEVTRNDGVAPEEILRRFESLVSKIKDMEDVTIVTNSDNKAPKLPPSIDKDADDFAKKRVEEIIDRMKRMIEERKKLDEERRKNVIN